MMKNLFLVLLSLYSLNAVAVNPTQGPLQQDSSLCSYGYNSNCNRGQSSIPPQKIIEHVHIDVPSKYGALALDSLTNTIGDSANANSLHEAKELAIRQCSNGGKNKHCKAVGWVRNGCMAAAGGKLGKIWKLTQAAEKPGYAEKAAMSKCKALGASNCSIVLPETCSFPNGMYD